MIDLHVAWLQLKGNMTLSPWVVGIRPRMTVISTRTFNPRSESLRFATEASLVLNNSLSSTTVAFCASNSSVACAVVTSTFTQISERDSSWVSRMQTAHGVAHSMAKGVASGLPYLVAVALMKKL